jgi:hypothetical protein
MKLECALKQNVGFLLPFFLLLSQLYFHSFSFSSNLKAFDFIGCFFWVELSSLGSLTLVEDPRGVSLASQAI